LFCYWILFLDLLCHFHIILLALVRLFLVFGCNWSCLAVVNHMNKRTELNWIKLYSYSEMKGLLLLFSIVAPHGGDCFTCCTIRGCLVTTQQLTCSAILFMRSHLLRCPGTETEIMTGQEEDWGDRIILYYKLVIEMETAITLEYTMTYFSNALFYILYSVPLCLHAHLLQIQLLQS
jgi:hypothetical protein